MRHRTSSAFWTRYRGLPAEVRKVADKNFRLLKRDPRHPSLRFKRIGKAWSVRVGENHRALGIDVDNGICWFWIGTRAEYDRLINQSRASSLDAQRFRRASNPSTRAAVV